MPLFYPLSALFGSRLLMTGGLSVASEVPAPAPHTLDSYRMGSMTSPLHLKVRQESFIWWWGKRVSLDGEAREFHWMVRQESFIGWWGKRVSLDGEAREFHLMVRQESFIWWWGKKVSLDGEAREFHWMVRQESFIGWWGKRVSLDGEAREFHWMVRQESFIVSSLCWLNDFLIGILLFIFIIYLFRFVSYLGSMMPPCRYTQSSIKELILKVVKYP